MANRYWVGGAGTWNTTSTTNWSASSGGASGASVPTAADSVFFDQAGTYTVTMTGALTCLDFTVSAGTVTFATGTTPTLAVSGSMTLLAGTLWTSTGRITFNATTTGKTLTSNGVSFAAPFTFNGSGGAWTLGSALTTTANVSGAITIQAGTFSTSATNYSVTAVGFTVSGGTLTLNGSTVTLTGTSNAYSYTSGTVNAGTSQITLTATPCTFAGGGQTYYNVTNNANSSSTVTITGANTFNNLTISATSAVIKPVTFSANQTVNGTLTVAGAAANNRIFIASDTIGTSRTITAAAISANDCDFRDITIAGAAAGSSPTRAGDCKGNSGITFPVAKTVYWNLAGTQNWSNTGWATSSGGSPAVNNFPLAQDTAVFDNTGSAGTVTINGAFNIGTLSMGSRTSAMTFALSSSSIYYGDFTIGTGVTISSSATQTFSGRTTQNITSAGQTILAIRIESPSGTLKLIDDLSVSSTSIPINHLIGTLNLNGKILSQTSSSATYGYFSSTNTVRNLTFNGGTLSIATSGTTAVNVSGANFSTTAGTGTGKITLTSASAKTFVGGGNTFNCTIDQNGAGALTITGANTFSNITNTYSATGATTITFPSSLTNTFTDWNANGAAGNLLTINSSSAGTRATISKASGTVSVSYLSIQDSNATGGATWRAYTSNGNVNNGNNLGWVFSVSNGNFLSFM